MPPDSGNQFYTPPLSSSPPRKYGCPVLLSSLLFRAPFLFPQFLDRLTFSLNLSPPFRVTRSWISFATFFTRFDWQRNSCSPDPLALSCECPWSAIPLRFPSFMAMHYDPPSVSLALALPLEFYVYRESDSPISCCGGALRMSFFVETRFVDEEFLEGFPWFSRSNTDGFGNPVSPLHIGSPGLLIFSS